MPGGTTITIVGAGVIGLTIAYVLSKDPQNNVFVVAEFMPGDYDIGYASPWAGANFLPMGAKGTLQAKLEAQTWPVLKRLAESVPEACIHVQDAIFYTRHDDVGTVSPPFANPGKLPWWHDLVDDFSIVPGDSLPDGIAHGISFKSVCINTALYLPYLVSQCRSQGVVFERKKLASLLAATEIPHPSGRSCDVVVNATGLGSRDLADVRDRQMTPARGQLMLVRNNPGFMVGVSPGKNGEGFGYTMTRAAGGGTVVGGCYQMDNSDPNIDPKLAQRFMQNCVDVSPNLVPKGKGIEGLEIIRHAVGLRPVRVSGVRIEKDGVGVPGATVIHCYGHGGWGYQASWGSAFAVRDLIQREKTVPRALL